MAYARRHPCGGAYGATEAEAVATFVDQIRSDRLAIAVCSRNGAVHDVRVSDDPAMEDQYAPAGEHILLRFWSGRAWHAG